MQVELNVMKMVGCSAVGCSNSSVNNNLSFHRLPKSIELHKTWLQAMRRVNIEEDKRLCYAVHTSILKISSEI